MEFSVGHSCNQQNFLAKYPRWHVELSKGPSPAVICSFVSTMSQPAIAYAIVGRHLVQFGRLRGSALETRLYARMVDLELPAEFLHPAPGLQSDAQKQRFCIAPALVGKVNVLVPDALTSALELLVEESEIKLLLRWMKERRLTLPRRPGGACIASISSAKNVARR
jgi:alpha-D-ribose 1-methylphosphonate 5-triphosphate synthase subunit PhnL